jgi:hypothetical protein
VGIYEKLVIDEYDEEEANNSPQRNIPTDQANAKKLATAAQSFRKNLRKSNKLTAVKVPRYRFELQETLPPPPLNTEGNVGIPAAQLSTEIAVEKVLHEEETDDDITNDGEEDLDLEERYERELMFDTQLWSKSNLKTKANLIGTHLKLGAKNTIEKTGKTIKKNIQKTFRSTSSSSQQQDRHGFHSNEEKETSFVDRHFAAHAAIRDFNETMPMVLPTNFEAKKGLVIRSDPSLRVQELEEEEERRNLAMKKKKKNQNHHLNQKDDAKKNNLFTTGDQLDEE